MSVELDYSAAGVPVRNDLKETHLRVWDHVRSPGTWWTGAERVAIAAETRKASACSLCLARKAALSPNAIQGKHDSAVGLPANVVDVIHRVVTDQARLSKEWFDSVIVGGLDDTHYVEFDRSRHRRGGCLTTLLGRSGSHRSLCRSRCRENRRDIGLPARNRPDSGCQ